MIIVKAKYSLFNKDTVISIREGRFVLNETAFLFLLYGG